MSAGDWFMIAIKIALVLAAAVWVISILQEVAKAPHGKRRERFMKGAGQDVAPVFRLAIAVGLLYWIAFELGASSNCEIDWDGRSNPTVCE